MGSPEDLVITSYGRVIMHVMHELLFVWINFMGLKFAKPPGKQRTSDGPAEARLETLL